MKKHWLKLFAVFVLLSSLLLSLQPVFAIGGGSGTVSLTTLGSPYTQDFDTLATTGTTNALGITGWYLDESGTSTANNGLYAGGTGSGTGGDTYSFGVAGTNPVTERAFGGLQSGTLIPTVGASFTNNTGATVTSLDVSYTGEMWRAGVTNRNAADRLDFQLSTDATSLTTGTWVDYNSLDYSSSNINTTAAALDGNAAANRTAISFSITSLSIPSGATFWIRWNSFDIAPGADDGLAVDDFSITPNDVVDPGASLSINDVSLVEGNAGTTSFDFTVTLSEPAPNDTTFSIFTSDNTATDADNDYEPQSMTATIPTGQTTYTFSVLVNGDTTSEPNETFFVNVTGFPVSDGQGQGTIQNDDVALRYIHEVQGNGASSPLDGIAVTIEGIVVGDFQDTTADPPNELNGYFVQEEDADADTDSNTSEGIFVFEGGNPTTPAVAVGDKVRVTGTVDEFGDVADGTYTEIVGPLTVEVLSSGNTLPTPALIDLPVASLSDYEKYESMSVSFVDELTVTEVFTLGRFGEVLLAAGGRLDTPTAVAEPGAPAQAVRDANILRSIVLDDGLTNQNPDPLLYPEPGGLSATNTLRGGDTTTGLSGVLHYFDTTEDFRVQPTGTISWNHANPRPVNAPVIPGALKVVGSNTLNYFTTLDLGPDICGPLNNQECRGADSEQEFTRQHDKLINMLIELNADVIGLNELENNAAAAPANDGNDPVLESIVDALNAAMGAGTYDFIDAGTIGTDAIKVSLIYKPGSVTPVGSFEILTSAYDPDFIDTRNRPVLAQTFEDANGGVFTVAVAHLKSKGSGCGAPDDQPDTSGGNCNGTRTAAAQVMVDWFTNHIATTSGDPDILLVGDLNSYAKEDPIDVFVNAGYVDLAATLADPYSYVFDGEWGYLDYGMASPTLYPQVAGVAEWHINADEPIVLDYNTEFKSLGQIISFYSPDPFRVSDHDPILVGLNLTVPDTTAPDTLINSAPPALTNVNDASFTFSSDDPTATFECQLDNGGWAACVSPQEYIDLADGSHTFEVRAVDAALNVDETPASHTWTVDTIAPETTITAFPPDPSNSADATFEFSSDDPTATFECQLDGGGWEVCASPKIYTGLSDGSHTFEVRAVDAANNVDPSPASYAWDIDTNGPTTTFTTTPSDPSNDATPTFEFTSETGATFECQLDGGLWTACTSPQNLGPLADGSHTFKVRATDTLGNTGPEASYTWIIATFIYDFNGFFPPVANPPAINQVKPGSTIQLKFNLGGNYGLDVFALGYPLSRPIDCTTGLPTGPDLHLNGVIKYNAKSDQYIFSWKTVKTWSGCREMVMLFDDGTQATALFNFKK